MNIKASDRAALLGIIGRFPEQRIVLLGDLVADEFIFGERTGHNCFFFRWTAHKAVATAT